MSTWRSVLKALTPTRLALLAGGLALLLGLYQEAHPHVLSGVLGWNVGYDDGPYLGATVFFARGVIPYKDFVFVQPPGILYLLSPIGVWSRFVGTHDAMMAARVLTVVVTAANATLAGLTLRRLGRLPTAIGAFAVALWPTAVAVNRTIELEPYLVLFCLLGAFVVFDRLEPSPRRLLWGGVAFGFAGVVKIWAILPIVAAVLCLLSLRWRIRPFVVGLLAGGIIPIVPFVLASPSAFWQQVLYSQLTRKGYAGYPADSLSERVLETMGFDGVRGVSLGSSMAIVALILVAASAIYVVARYWRTLDRLAWFAIASAFITWLGMFGSPNLFEHYAYFPAVFIAMMVGVTGSVIIRDLRPLGERVASRLKHPSTVPVLGMATAGLAVVVVVLLGLSSASYAKAYLSEAWNPAPLIDATIPAGACTLSDYPSDLLMANRFVSSDPSCTKVADPFGEFLVYDNGQPPTPIGPYPSSFLARWQSALSKADYLDVRVAYSDFLPWDNAQMTWFSQNYHLVVKQSAPFSDGLFDRSSQSFIYANTNFPSRP